MAEPQRAVFHVFAGIMWSGRLITSLGWTGISEDREESGSERAASASVMVHAAGFYTVEKQKSLGVAPEQVHWFRWRLMKVGERAVLLVLCIPGGWLIDPDIADIPSRRALRLEWAPSWRGGSFTILAVRSPFGKSQAAFADLAW